MPVPGSSSWLMRVMLAPERAEAEILRTRGVAGFDPSRETADAEHPRSRGSGLDGGRSRRDAARICVARLDRSRVAVVRLARRRWPSRGPGRNRIRLETQ